MCKEITLTKIPAQKFKTIIFSCCFFTVTGLYAQHGDSISITTNEKFSLKQAYFPSGLILSGLLANGNSSESFKNEVAEELNEHFPHFKTHADDYLQFSPIIIAYSLDAFGIKSKTDFANRTVILLKSELIMYSTVALLKNTTHVLRPDKSSYTSFPSGHTAQAFAAATFLNEEYGEQFKWMPFLSYGIATGVGGLRIANNKHYISDVLVGAGIGVVSTKIAYWSHAYRLNKNKALPAF